MDLIDRLRELVLRIPNQLPHLGTEEATKTALVMPFISALGYNVFDPTEVVPEYNADVGTKKGEKVDYAVIRDGTPIMLFECKSAQSDLSQTHASQLYRYFSVTPARFGILTNGVVYKFYSDLDDPNKMDSRPFLEFNLLALDEGVAENLKRFAKQSFDLDEIISTAGELKYLRGIQRLLGEEWQNPSGGFVRLFASRVYSGNITQAVKEQFTALVKRAFHEFVSGRVNERLKSALERSETREGSGGDGAGDAPIEHEEDEGTEDRGLVTTDEEMDGFHVVRAIVAEVVDPMRVFVRDTKRYCGIILDDTNRKPICRLWFDSGQKYIGLFDAEKNETRHEIDGPYDLYRFAVALKETVRRYEGRAHGEPEHSPNA